MLRARGVPPIASAEQASGRQVLIRSHGVAPQVLEALHRCGAQVLDLTCPFVDKLHRIVEGGVRAGMPGDSPGREGAPRGAGHSRMGPRASVCAFPGR